MTPIFQSKDISLLNRLRNKIQNPKLSSAVHIFNHRIWEAEVNLVYIVNLTQSELYSGTQTNKIQKKKTQATFMLLIINSSQT